MIQCSFVCLSFVVVASKLARKQLDEILSKTTKPLQSASNSNSARGEEDDQDGGRVCLADGELCEGKSPRGGVEEHPHNMTLEVLARPERVYRITNFMSAEECDELVRMGEQHLQQKFPGVWKTGMAYVSEFFTVRD